MSSGIHCKGDPRIDGFVKNTITFRKHFQFRLFCCLDKQPAAIARDVEDELRPEK